MNPINRDAASGLRPKAGAHAAPDAPDALDAVRAGAEPLLLLPGMMCDARLFAPQIASLSAARAVQVAPLGGADSMEALAAGVLADAPPRFALAGLSMGGIVAMEVIRQAPERVTRLALLDTNPRAEVEEMRRRRDPQMAQVRQGGEAALLTVMREVMIPNYAAPETLAGPEPDWLPDLCLAMAAALGPEAFLRQSRALRDRPDQQETLRAVRVPALVLCGAADRLCPLERHELMRDLIPGARLEVIAGAGHLPTLERPEETNAALRRWLEE